MRLRPARARMGDVCTLSDCFIACERFLNTNGYFRLVEDRCKFFSCLQDQAFELVIPIDVFDLLEYDGNLGNFVLNDTLKASEIFRDVIFMKILEEGWLTRCRLKSQLSVRLRISTLPPFECYQIPELCLYRSKICQNKLVQIIGKISGISVLQKYLKSTKFKCIACKRGEFTFLRHFGTSDKMLFRRCELNCKVCGSKMEEDVSHRVLADKVSFHIMDSDENKQKKMIFSIVACARDELASGVQLGRLCVVVGIPIYNFKRKLHVFEVLGMTPMMMDSQMNSSRFSLRNIFPSVPQSINTLFYDRKESYWSFVFSLAYAFADKVVPKGTFQFLKLALLLSLVSCSKKAYSGLDILVEGTDSLIISRLLLYSCQFAQTFSVINSNSVFLPTFCTDRAGIKYVEGGYLNLCDGGVCLIPELLYADKSLREKIVKILDSGNTFPSSDMGLTTSQYLEYRTCQMWTYLETVNCVPFELRQTPRVIAAKFDVLINMFPVVIKAEMTPRTVPDELIIDNVFSQMQCIDAKKSIIPHEDFVQFINCLREWETSLTKESQDLIRSYYIASRTSRSFMDSSFLMPRTAIRTITCLAESFAKLNLKQEVAENDALFAIYFYEEMLTCKTGVSAMGLMPVLHMYDENLHTSIGLLVDEKLYSFKELLINFLHRHCDALENCDIDLNG